MIRPARPSPLGLLACVACLVGVARAQPAPPAEAAPTRPSIVLVSFDTLRRDHVSCYGSRRLTTPTVDALASKGVRFTDCQAVIPVTGPGHASILTGLYPQTHGSFRNGVPLPPGPRTLAEVLQVGGWRTAAFVAGWTLKSRQCGLARGFDHYDEDGMEDRYSVVNLMRRADRVTDAALSWLEADRSTREAATQPYFLFVHYFDPHEPYDSPVAQEPPPNPSASPVAARGRSRARDADEAAYDREVAFADREMGRLLDGMASMGLLENTLVVFTADHGQSFGEHGEKGHGRRVFQSTLAVPLVLAWPGRVPAGDCELPITHLDLVPTLVELAGLPSTVLPSGVQGLSLARRLLDPSAPPPWGNAERVRHAVAFAGAVGNKWNIFRWAQNRDVDRALPLRAAALVRRHKVVIDPRQPERVEVYDLDADPLETKPIEDEGQRYASYAPKILDWFSRTRTELKDVAVSDADLAKLRALGYVE